MQYQWYPGHMAKAKRQMQEDIKLIDVVVELVDARIPYASKNPDIDDIAKGKARVIILNKVDMADKDVTARWQKWYEKRGFFVALVNSRSGSGVRSVQDVINEACKEKIERDRRRGISNRPVRAMIVGIPNVGKSTFINTFAGKSVAKTGNKPGVTKGKQWIRLNKNTELLDTPGILWPKFESVEVGKKISWIGSINDNILVPEEMAIDLLNYIVSHYPGMIAGKYDVEESLPDDAPDALLNRIAARRGCLKKGGEFDLERAANLVLEDFRAVRIGAISLEIPEEAEDAANQ